MEQCMEQMIFIQNYRWKGKVPKGFNVNMVFMSNTSWKWKSFSKNYIAVEILTSTHIYIDISK